MQKVLNVKQDLPGEATTWSPILAKTKLGPHKQHFFNLTPLSDSNPITHVKVVIWPDGGIKRIRLMGRPFASSSVVQPSDRGSVQRVHTSEDKASQYSPSDLNSVQVQQAVQFAIPLSKEGFAAYGSVIETYARSIPPSAEDDERSLKISTRMDGVDVKTVNFGSARKYSYLASLVWNSPVTETPVLPTLNVCVFQCRRQTAPADGLWPIKALERHQYSSQAFVPMNGCQPGRYLVAVALPNSSFTSHRLHKMMNARYRRWPARFLYTEGVCSWTSPRHLLSPQCMASSVDCDRRRPRRRDGIPVSGL